MGCLLGAGQKQQGHKLGSRVLQLVQAGAELGGFKGERRRGECERITECACMAELTSTERVPWRACARGLSDKYLERTGS